MPTSIDSVEVQTALTQLRQPQRSPKVTPLPEDWRDVWIYFLMVDRFNNPINSLNKSPYDTNCGDFQGGTIEGIRQKLDYLKDLGVGALWFTPVLKNCQFINGAKNEGTYHGYGIQNFLEIDPRFASDPQNPEQELRTFIDEAHAKGIYIIFDIVLNHTGDVFAYPSGSSATYQDNPYPIGWRDANGQPRSDWNIAENIPSPPADATVFPDELRRNEFFRRQGVAKVGGAETIGDFSTLKQLLTGNPELGNVLIRSFQYLIAKFDIDGFRIDTLKYLDPNFALTFGNAIREYALSIGKKNFFTFGEVYDGEEKITQFIGRNVSIAGDLVGVDASLDFPLFFKLPSVLKGSLPPSEVVGMYQHRKVAEQNIISSHGEATRFFVTFLDNHDQHQRFYFSAAGNPQQFDDQATLGFACLFSLPGIPSLYYGSEQGLHGNGDSDLNVREALWGKPNAFDTSHPFYKTIQQITKVRNEQPALRYGRFYFRPISGDSFHFGISTFTQGVLSFSRILNDQEVLVIANTNSQSGFSGSIIVDSNLNPIGKSFQVLFSNKTTPATPGLIELISSAEVQEVSGGISKGAVTAISVTLKPMEIQILGRP
jgi:glycosidase